MTSTGLVWNWCAGWPDLARAQWEAGPLAAELPAAPILQTLRFSVPGTGFSLILDVNVRQLFHLFPVVFAGKIRAPKAFGTSMLQVPNYLLWSLCMTTERPHSQKLIEFKKEYPLSLKKKFFWNKNLCAFVTHQLTNNRSSKIKGMENLSAGGRANGHHSCQVKHCAAPSNSGASRRSCRITSVLLWDLIFSVQRESRKVSFLKEIGASRLILCFYECPGLNPSLEFGLF